MSTDMNPLTMTDDGQVLEDGVPVDVNDSPDIRELRKKAKKFDEAQKRAAELERKLRFVEAGVNLTDKRSRYFMAGYDGEESVEAVQVAWKEFIGEPLHAEDPAKDAELDGIDRIASATGAPNPGKAPDWVQKMAEAQSPDEVLAIVEAAGGHTSRNTF